MVSHEHKPSEATQVPCPVQLLGHREAREGVLTLRIGNEVQLPRRVCDRTRNVYCVDAVMTRAAVILNEVPVPRYSWSHDDDDESCSSTYCTGKKLSTVLHVNVNEVGVSALTFRVVTPAGKHPVDGQGSVEAEREGDENDDVPTTLMAATRNK